MSHESNVCPICRKRQTKQTQLTPEQELLVSILELAETEPLGALPESWLSEAEAVLKAADIDWREHTAMPSAAGEAL